jgi:hypothetical protein
LVEAWKNTLARIFLFSMSILFIISYYYGRRALKFAPGPEKPWDGPGRHPLKYRSAHAYGDNLSKKVYNTKRYTGLDSGF